MTRNEKKIRKLAKELGIEITSIKWEPWGQAMEMCGPSGGWIVNDGEFCSFKYWRAIRSYEAPARSGYLVWG